MASIQLVVRGQPFAVSLASVFDPIPGVDDDAIALARAVQVALGTDRRALPDDSLPTLPQPGQMPDRRGWWGDLEADAIWGGWPIGTRLWVMSRDAITEAGAQQGATIERARRYIVEALQPFVDAGMATAYDVTLTRSGLHQITGSITIYRGPKDALALEYQSLWTAMGG